MADELLCLCGIAYKVEQKLLTYDVCLILSAVVKGVHTLVHAVKVYGFIIFLKTLEAGRNVECGYNYAPPTCLYLAHGTINLLFMIAYASYYHVATGHSESYSAAIIGSKALIFPIEHTVGWQILEHWMIATEEVSTIP